MKVWVLTYEINEYDQDGEYFLAVFENKPTEDILAKYIPNATATTLKYILDIGGREDREYKWYYLRELVAQ